MAATSKTSWDKLKCYAVTMARTPEGASARHARVLPCSIQLAVRLIPPCPSSRSSSPIQSIVILSPLHYWARTTDEALKPNIEDKEESSPCRPHRGAYYRRQRYTTCRTHPQGGIGRPKVKAAPARATETPVRYRWAGGHAVKADAAARAAGKPASITKKGTERRSALWR